MCNVVHNLFIQVQHKSKLKKVMFNLTENILNFQKNGDKVQNIAKSIQNCNY